MPTDEPDAAGAAGGAEHGPSSPVPPAFAAPPVLPPAPPASAATAPVVPVARSAVSAPDAAAPAGETLGRLGSLSPARVFRLGFFLALGVLAASWLAQVIGHLGGIIIVVVVALFVALGVQPVIEWLIRRGLPRPAAAALVTLALAGVVVLAGWALVPLVVDQGTRFVENAPAYLQSLRSFGPFAQLDAQFGIVAKATEQLSSGAWLGALFGGAAGLGLAAANLLTSVALTSVLMLFFVFSAPAIKDAIYEMAPASLRPRARYLANEIFQRMGDYLLSMLLVVSLWGVGSFIALTVAGLGQYALALALVVMLLTAIPAIGSFIAMALCTLVALSASPAAALGVLAYFLVYQQIDAYVVQPRLFARSLKVPPALAILGVACGMALLGALGALLAIPTVASLLLLYRELVVPRLDAS